MGWERLFDRGFILDGDGRMKDRLFLSGIGIVSFLVLLTVGFILVGRQAQIRGDYEVSVLPALNAVLNGTSAILLTVGYLFIRRKKVAAHKTCMLMAFGSSSLLDRKSVV